MSSRFHYTSISLPPPQFPSAQGASYQSLQSTLSSCAATLNVAGSEVMTAAKSTPEHQAEASAKFAKTFNEMLTAGLTLAGASKVRLLTYYNVALFRHYIHQELILYIHIYA